MVTFRQIKCYGYSYFIYRWILIQFYTNVLYNNISSKFNIHVAWLKIKVTMIIFEKQNFVIALAPEFTMDFNVSFQLLRMISRPRLTLRVQGLESRSLSLFVEKPGPSCSNLTTSLVNVSLKFQMLIFQIQQMFLLKKCEKLL